MQSHHLSRSRWAAIGAAVAVTLGGGGLIGVSAASGDASSFTSVTPTRVLDTRTGVKLSTETVELQVAGDGQVAPEVATAIAINVTVTGSETKGYVSVFPCTAKTDSPPNASTLNFNPGVDLANSTVVEIGSTGKVCFYVKGITHLLADAQGYYTQASTGTVDAYTKSETDTQLATKANQTDVDTLENTVNTKANQTDVDTLENTVNTKANQTDVDTLENTVNTKANQTDVDTLDSDKADVSALLALATGMQIPITIDSGGVGEYTSIAIGDNGNPIISYYDFSNGHLEVAACTTTDCTGTATITTVDSADGVGGYSSIAIGDNGLPVISYYDGVNSALKVAACTTTDCTGTATITTVDSADSVGWYTSIAIGNNGNPIISYTDFSNSALKVAACTTTDCTETATITTIDSTGDVGGDTSIAIGANGFPVISYYDATNGQLEVAACTTTNCTDTATITTIDSTGSVGRYTSIAIRDNGNPIISYYDITNSALKVAACTTTDCTETATITTIDSTGNVGKYTSIAIGANGFPVISYYDATNGQLEVAACTTTNCTGTTTITTIDSTGSVGQYTSIAIGANGFPVISYYDATNSALKVVPMWSLLIGN
jgi:hypothetical protein